MATTFSISRVGLEVYTTLEEDAEESEKIETSSTKETTTDTTDTTADTESEDTNKIKYETGEITQINYISEAFSDSFEQDYSDISSNATVSMPINYINHFYKGRRVCLKKGLQNKTDYKWDDMVSACLGFITEISYNMDKVEVKISGMDKLLDQEKQFTFSQRKRSEIVKEIIESSGLKAKVDVTGLVDDVCDFTNVSSSGDSGSGENSGLKGGQGEDIDKLVAKWVGSETDELKKAQKIHAGLRDDVGIIYQYYYNSKYETPENCLKHANSPGLNCGDTAILTTACMLSGGLTAYIVLRCDSAHYFTVIEIGGKKYYSDLTWSEGARSQRPWNEVWQGNTCGNKYNDGTRIPVD